MILHHSLPAAPSGNQPSASHLCCCLFKQASQQTSLPEDLLPLLKLCLFPVLLGFLDSDHAALLTSDFWLSLDCTALGSLGEKFHSFFCLDQDCPFQVLSRFFFVLSVICLETSGRSFCPRCLEILDSSRTEWKSHCLLCEILLVFLLNSVAPFQSSFWDPLISQHETSKQAFLIQLFNACAF